MVELIIISDELVDLSKKMVETIEKEDKEYEFKKNKVYIERNVPASKFKFNNLIGLKQKDFEEIISQ